MKRTSLKIPALALMACAALTSGANAAGVLTGTAVLNTSTGNYDYSYSVQNTSTTEDIILVNFAVDKMSSILGITTPQGFSGVFDPSQGWFNITEDNSIATTQTFAPGSTVAPFNFSSRYAPGPVTYTISQFSGDTTGTVVSPVVNPVPEPSGLLLTALAGLTVTLRRSRQARR